VELIGAVARSLRNASPVAYTAPGAPGLLGNIFGRGNRVQQLEAMGTVSTLFAVVSAIAQAAAQQEWWLERVTRDTRRMYGPDQPNRTQVLQHPAADLWARPNPFYSRHDLVESTTQHLMLVGEGIWVIATDPRAPTLPLELWPVRPDRMTPVPSAKDFLAGWVYTAPGGEQVPLETWQVIQVKLPNPMDPYRGMGPVQALLADLDSVRFSAEWNRRFFLNDATPGGVIEMEDNLGDAEFNRLRDRWYEQHRGVRNAHRVAFLERAKWVERSFTMRDMQFVQLREVSQGMIREAFRIHKAILGQSDDVNRANADAADYQLAKWNISPILSRYRGALNTRLLPLYGDPVTTEFCFESPVEEDAATELAELTGKAGAYATLVGTGVHPDDAAMIVGLPPMRQVAAAPQPEAVPA
jgi:HK97 family phage portal protein